jgi:hypothetical protein
LATINPPTKEVVIPNPAVLWRVRDLLLFLKRSTRKSSDASQ